MDSKTVRYVIRREDGTFYWKGNTSSLYGYDDFEHAFIFQTKAGAKKRVFTAKPFSAEILEVELTLKDTKI